MVTFNCQEERFFSTFPLVKKAQHFFVGNYQILATFPKGLCCGQKNTQKLCSLKKSRRHGQKERFKKSFVCHETDLLRLGVIRGSGQVRLITVGSYQHVLDSQVGTGLAALHGDHGHQPHLTIRVEGPVCHLSAPPAAVACSSLRTSSSG